MKETEKLKAFKLQLGTALQDIRMEKTSLSQTEMGKLISITQKGISNIESGKHLANSYVVYMYCKICKTSPSELFEKVDID